jgi:hypothetical protein
MSISTDYKTRYTGTLPEVALKKSTPSATDPTPAVDRLQAGITPMGYMISITLLEWIFND